MTPTPKSAEHAEHFLSLAIVKFCRFSDTQDLRKSLSQLNAANGEEGLLMNGLLDFDGSVRLIIEPSTDELTIPDPVQRPEQRSDRPDSEESGD